MLCMCMSIAPGSPIYASDINQNLIVVSAISSSKLASTAVGDDTTLATVASSYFTGYYLIGCVVEVFGQQRSLETTFLQIALLPTGAIKGVELKTELSTQWNGVPLHFVFLRKQ